MTKFNKRTNKLRVFVFVISVIVAFSAMQLNLLASDVDLNEIDNIIDIEAPENADAADEREGFYEVTELREEHSKHFHFSDDTYRAVTYAEPVHRKDADGAWQDIDNRLLSATSARGKATYSTGDGRITFAKSSADFATEGVYTISENGYTVSLLTAPSGLPGELTAGDVSFESPSGTSTAAITNHSLPEAISDSESDEVKFEKASKINNTSTVLYENVFVNTDLEYVLSSNTVKENIIVKAPRESYSYTFILTTGRLVATAVGKQIILADSETGEHMYYMPAPYMYDADGDVSYDASYTLTTVRDGQYLLTVTADATWMNSTDRTFPVVIDPTTETGFRATYDLYVSSEYPSTKYGNDTEMWVSDTQISLIQVTMPTLPDNRIITNAELWIRYYYNTTSGYMTIGAYEYLHPWSSMYTDWNFMNSYPNMGISTTLSASTLLEAGQNITATSPGYAFLELTALVRKWYNGTSSNYGVALKRIAANSTNQAVIIAAYDNNTLPNDPEDPYVAYYIIDYQLLEEGVYGIQNVANSNLWMDIQHDSTEPDAHVQQYAFSSSPVTSFTRSGLFKITFHGGMVNIRTMLNNELFVCCDSYNSNPSDYITTREGIVGEADIAFEIIPTDEAGVFQIFHGDKVVCANNSTSSGHAGQPDSYMRLKTPNDAGNTGKWEFVKYVGAETKGITWRGFDNEIMVGQTVDYDAVMYSTNVQHNGQITYSVSATSGGTTDKATIDPATGVLKADKAGTVQIRATYSGSGTLWKQIITIKPAGCKEYYEIIAGSDESYDINCQGYAFWTHNDDQSWCDDYWHAIAAQSETSNQALVDAVTINGNTVNGIKELLEDNFLDVYFSGRWEEVPSSSGGLDIEVDPDNQWLVAFRMGRDASLDCRVGCATVYAMDYHFWYRTNTGEWVDKHSANGTPSERLGDDLPIDDDSIGWYKGSYEEFYNSDIIYYVLTEAE